MYTLRYLVIFLSLFLSLTVDAQNPEEEVQEILQKLDSGQPIENMVISLSDINFKTGTSTLEPIARSYLDEVIRLLRKAPNIDLFIKGHTDNVGSDAVNNQLSLNRALSVQTYLTNNGIEQARLMVKGFGSSAPIAPNTTADGRGKNRRVELEVLKKEETKNIQDLIVMRNGKRIGSVVLNYNEENIQYKQFSKDDTLLISTGRVHKIIFSDGSEKVFNPEKEKFNFANWWNENVLIFKESESFHKGSFVLGLGLGLKNNVEVKYSANKVQAPPSMLIAEIPVGYNFGVGFSAGVMRWTKKEIPDIPYMYYAFSPRVSYHFNLGQKLDLYTGLALNGRMVTVTAQSVSLNRKKVDAGLILGTRYYIKPWFGFFGEIGNENVAYGKLGLAFNFGN